MRLLASLPLLLLPLSASAGVVWKGDFETGNLSQWTRSQMVSSDRLLVVDDPVVEGRYALKASVRQGDDPANASGNRNELIQITDEREGDEYFYSWSTLFPEDYPSNDTWQVFTQWHHSGCCGSPPLEFFVRGEKMNLRIGGSQGKVVWQAPLRRGEWRRFALQVKWSPDPEVGFVSLWLDGEQVVEKAHGVTLYAGEWNYLKQGLYRDEAVAEDAAVFHDGFTMATTLEDVLPPPPPVAEPTQPDAGSGESGPVASNPPTGGPTQSPDSPFGSANNPLEAGGIAGAQGCSSGGGGGSLALAALAGGMIAFALSRRRRAARVTVPARRRR